MLQLIVADCLASRILGTITLLNTLGGAIGPFITGILYDTFNTYTVSFSVIAALVLLATLGAMRVELAQM